jgi:hypothetical protein
VLKLERRSDVEETRGTIRRLANYRIELLLIKRATGRHLILESNRYYPQGWRYRIVDITKPEQKQYFEWLTFRHMDFFIQGLVARAKIEEKR